MAFTKTTGALIGCLLEVLLYGAYVMVFYEHVRIICRRRTFTLAFKYQVFTAVSLFLLITMRTVVDMTQVIEAFSGSEDATTVLFDFPRILNRLKIGLYSAEVLDADLFLVYRVYVLWGHSWMVALVPFLCWIVLCAFNIWGNLTLFESLHDAYGRSATSRVAKFPLIGTIVLNVICTALIAGRIWWVQRTSRTYSDDYSKDPVSRAFLIIVESASIYVGWLIALVATQILKSPVYQIILSFISPVIGIVFSTIIVRSSADTTLNNTYTMRTRPSEKVSNFRAAPPPLDGSMDTSFQSSVFRAATPEDEDKGKRMMDGPIEVTTVSVLSHRDGRAGGSEVSLSV